MTTPGKELLENANSATHTSNSSGTAGFLGWSVFNRDLSQLEFFRRVLEEATDDSLPVLERLKFLAVFTSNLDEFFMVRVSGLKEMLEVEDIPPMPGELTPAEQLKAIREQVLPMVEQQVRCLRDSVRPQLAKQRVVVTPILDANLKRYLKDTVLAAYLKDNVKARVLNADGSYERVPRAAGEEPFNSQLFFEGSISLG